MTNLSISDAWIGIQHNNPTQDNCDLPCKRRGWYWLDGTQYDLNVFHDWHTDEPTGDSECARMNILNGWMDRLCTITYQYVCSKGRQDYFIYICNVVLILI